MKEHRNSLNAVQALKTPLPLHRIVIEIYEESFCSTITNQKETLHKIHQSEKTRYDFLLAPDSAFFKHPPLPLFPSQKLRHQVSQSVHPISKSRQLLPQKLSFSAFRFSLKVSHFFKVLGLFLQTRVSFKRQRE